ncbi:MAG: nucleotidyltransferase family protein [Usitatibacter sp.]
MKRGEPREVAPAGIDAPICAEARLLLLCARIDVTGEQRAAISELATAPIDWELLLELATRHGLLPLLHRHLDAFASTVVPKAAMASLWAHHEALKRRNRAMASELVEIVALLSRHGIKVVPYKGPSLAVAVYGDLSLREFGDLDLLVRPVDAIEIARLLAARGYVAEYELPHALALALVNSRRHYELPLRNADRNMLVELHWRADPEFDITRVDDASWWRELGRVEICGESLPALVAREQLLILCLHGTKHFWAGLGWLVDVAELLRKDQWIDWPWILGTARQLGCERKLGVGLRLATDLLSAPLPEDVLSLVGDSEVIACAGSIRGSLFLPRYQAPGIAWQLRANVRLHVGWVRRARFLVSMAFTPGLGEWQRWSLPRSLFALYWLLRPIRLFEKYALRRTPPAAKPRTPPPQPHSTG